MKSLTIENTIDIKATSANVWDALTNPDQTQKYMFGCRTESDWQPGSPLLWKMMHEGVEIIAVKGTVVKVSAPTLLSYTVFDPNSQIKDIPVNYLTVTYELEDTHDGTRLKVTQGDYLTVADGQKRYEESYNDGEGWNPILVQIKKTLESD